MHDLRHVLGQRFQLAEEVLADDDGDLDVGRRQRARPRRLVAGGRPVAPDDLAELRDEPVALVVGPAEREQLLELIEDEDETLKVVAPPHLEPAEQVPQRRPAPPSERRRHRMPRDGRRLESARSASRIWSSMSWTDRRSRAVEADDDGEEVALGAAAPARRRSAARSCRFRTRRRRAIGRTLRIEWRTCVDLLRPSPEQQAVDLGVAERRRAGVPVSGQVPVRDRSARRGRVVRCRSDDLTSHHGCPTESRPAMSTSRRMVLTSSLTPSGALRSTDCRLFRSSI